jgi:hypothetical protein
MDLKETILNLEGKPKKTKMQPEFEVWLRSIDHTQRTRVIQRMMGIHKKGLYGKKSHNLFDSCPGLYEIVFDEALRVYFTIDGDISQPKSFIILEDGSHSKSGGKTTGSQQRTIDRVSKRLKDSMITNRQWYEDFVSPTELLLSISNEDEAFDDFSSQFKHELELEVAQVIAQRNNTTIEEVLDL